MKPFYKRFLPYSFAGALCLGCAGMVFAQPDGRPPIQPPQMQQPSIPQPGIQHPSIPQPGIQHPSIPQPGMQQPSMPQPGIQHPSIPQPGMQQPGMQPLSMPKGPGHFDPKAGFPGQKHPDLKGQFRPDGKPGMERPDLGRHKPDMKGEFNKEHGFGKDRPQMEHRPGQKNHREFKKDFNKDKDFMGKHDRKGKGPRHNREGN